MYRSPGPSGLAISCQTGRICNGRSVELGPEDARSSNGDFPAVNKERAAAHGREIASFPLVDAIDSQRRIGMAKSKRHAVAGATQPVRHRLHERLHQHDIDHGGLVDNQQVTVERVVVATVEAAALRVKSPSNFPEQVISISC